MWGQSLKPVKLTSGHPPQSSSQLPVAPQSRSFPILARIPDGLIKKEEIVEEEEEEEQEMKCEQAMSHVREYLGRAGGGWETGGKNNPMSLYDV